MKYLRLLLVPLALVCLGLVRLLKRFGILIRFGEFYSWRIGHLAGNTECYLCERDDGRQPKSWDIWVHKGEVSSKQLAKMIERVLWVDKTGFVKVMVLLNAIFRGGEKHYATSAQLDRDIYGMYAKYPPHLKFTKKEEERGERTLREWGIPKGAKWVCFIVRDGAYLPNLPYHAYRDSDVQTYWLAMLELANRGYYVFRMGAKVEKAFHLQHLMFFDYATNGMLSDFMTVYLGAKCEFCVSNGTGFDAIPAIFRRPICFVNYVPFEYLNTWVESVAIWKHHYKDGKRMTISEIVQSGAGQFMRSDEFEQAGITLVDNTHEEIADAVLEMHGRKNGSCITVCPKCLEETGRWHELFYVWKEGVAMCEVHGEMLIKDIFPDEAQETFWRSFPRSISPYNSKPLHGEIRMRIGAKFLSQYDQR